MFKVIIKKAEQDIIDGLLKAENGIEEAVKFVIKNWNTIQSIAEDIIKLYTEIHSMDGDSSNDGLIVLVLPVDNPKPTQVKRKYNLRKQKEDARDYKLAKILKPHADVQLPAMVDLRSLCPPVFDQGQLGSCTANAGIAAYMMLKKTNDMKSRLFQYYEERVLEAQVEGDQTIVQQDSGACIRDIVVILNNNGACPESDMPYSDDQSVLTEVPSPQVISDAGTSKIGSYYSVPDVNGIKQVLALKQEPVCIGISVYDSFESSDVAQTGIIPIPDTTKETVQGGHAVLVVGYDDSKQWFIVRNSWGDSWGDKGYFYLPYEFFNKGFASDFWVMQD